jgi:hypothetical protein
MRGAERADGGLGAVAEREGECHPRTDACDEQTAGGQPDPGEGEAVVADADVGRKPRDDAECEADARQQQDEHEIVAGGRQRVQVSLRDEEDQHERDDEGTAIQLPLARLAKHEKDEHGVDEVIGSSHAAMIGRAARAVVGAGVDLRLVSPSTRG